MAIKIFFSYAHEDEELLKRLKAQLRPLQREGLIEVWHDRDISAGTEWEGKINEHLKTAEIILLLISPDFMNSDYCYSIEMKKAIERHENGKARVIPIILDYCHWQIKPLNKLQALPQDAEPTTNTRRWHNLNEAFFNVAEGIRKVVEEITIRQIERKIRIFGYETDGGRNSVHWNNPFTFSFSKEYQAWSDTKRDFREEEIIGSTWLKVSDTGNCFVIHFLKEGELKENWLSNQNQQWSGSWKIIESGTLRINIDEYEIDIIANREEPIDSGIEFYKSQDVPDAYFMFFLPQQLDRKYWAINDIPRIVDNIYTQVLHREAVLTEMITYGSLLHRGEISVRDMVKILGISPEYRKHFIDTKTVSDAIELCYEHFLCRKVEDFGRSHYTEKLKTIGFPTMIMELIDSVEYKREIGEHAVGLKI